MYTYPTHTDSTLCTTATLTVAWHSNPVLRTAHSSSGVQAFSSLTFNHPPQLYGWLLTDSFLRHALLLCTLSVHLDHMFFHLPHWHPQQKLMWYIGSTTTLYIKYSLWPAPKAQMPPPIPANCPPYRMVSLFPPRATRGCTFFMANLLERPIGKVSWFWLWE